LLGFDLVLFCLAIQGYGRMFNPLYAEMVVNAMVKLVAEKT
jgi:hypothetical protein